MKNLLFLLVLLVLFVLFCSGGSEFLGMVFSFVVEQEVFRVDVFVDEGFNKGIGEVKIVDFNDLFVKSMVEVGESIYEMKCVACYKLIDQWVVGLGWKGFMEKWELEWIMNMIINVDVMLVEDFMVQVFLEECLVCMFN